MDDLGGCIVILVIIALIAVIGRIGWLSFGYICLAIATLGLAAYLVTITRWWRLRRGNKALVVGRLRDALAYFKAARHVPGLLEVAGKGLADVREWHDVVLRAYSAVGDERGLKELANKCVRCAPDSSEEKPYLGGQLLRTALQACKKADYREGLASIRRAALSMADKWEPDARSSANSDVPLCSIAIEACEHVSDTRGLIEIADVCLSRADAQREPAKQLPFLHSALAAYSAASHAAGLRQLACTAVVSAKSGGPGRDAVDTLRIAQQAFAAVNDHQGVTSCRALAREIGRRELDHTASRLRPSALTYTPGTGDPILIVRNSGDTGDVEVVIDRYDEYRVPKGNGLSLQIEPGLHSLEFIPVPGSSGDFGAFSVLSDATSIKTIQGTIELARDHTYMWAMKVVSETRTVYTYH